MNPKQAFDIQNNKIKQQAVLRKPPWLKVSLPVGRGYRQVREVVTSHKLNTVCESACCPNRGECWSTATATFMILGNICTRSCGFCNVATGRPTELDEEEPGRIAQAVHHMQLRYVVLTSVNRDELADGGASIWAETIAQVRLKCPDTRIEVLIPDFCGKWDALDLVLAQCPDVLNHNTETVPRLYHKVRPQAKFDRSLEVLLRAKKAGAVTKSGLMLGLGERDEEILEVMRELRGVHCSLLTLGQYMQPTLSHLPVVRWVTPETFAWLAEEGKSMGFTNVFAGPLVRSSYHAEEQANSPIVRAST